VPPLLSVVEDTDDYTRSIAGVEIDVVRTGPGSGPSVVRAVSTDRTMVSAASIRFPMLTHTTIGEDHIVTGFVKAAPSGARWCEIDLLPGMVLAYSPGAEHTGINPEGLDFSFVVSRTRDLQQVADKLKSDFRPPPSGEVHALAPSPETIRLGRTLAAHLDGAAEGIAPTDHLEDILLHAMVRILADDRREERIGARRKINDRRVAHDCIAYAESVGRVPSIRELCDAAHVSERRLRTAFAATFGMSPGRFFRVWALDVARKRLAGADSGEASVTSVAIDLGISHVGRFAGRYRAVYGESPSETLRSNRRPQPARPVLDVHGSVGR